MRARAYIAGLILCKYILGNCRPEWLCRYSDSLRDGRSGDRIPLGRDFPHPLHTVSGAHPTSYTMVTGYYSGVKLLGRGVDHPHNPLPRLKKSRAISVLHLWAFEACSSVKLTFFTFYVFGAWTLLQNNFMGST